MNNLKGNVCRLCGKRTEDYIVLEEHYICTDCASAIEQMISSVRIFEEDQYKNTERSDSTCVKFLKPVEIKAELDRYVVGQEQAKKILSVACYNHYKRNEMHDKNIKKSNILLVGPTGSGKTYLVQKLADILNVPVAMAAATTLTEAGYIGDDVESVIKKLLDAAGGDVNKAEKGIVFIDEIDKLSGKSSETEKKVGGKGVQQALLPLIEGTIVSIDKSGPMGGGLKINVDTSGILFICGGAFPEAEQIIKKRLSKRGSIGFNAVVEREEVSDHNILLNITNEDLREFGLIPEFIGRLPVIAPLESMTAEILRKILTEPKDSIISQYRTLMKFDGVELFFEDEALDLIAEKALKKGTGARSLRGILEELLMEIMFTSPTREGLTQVIITKDYVNGVSEPQFIYNFRTASSY